MTERLVYASLPWVFVCALAAALGASYAAQRADRIEKAIADVRSDVCALPVKPAIDNPLATLKNTTVVCPGSASAAIVIPPSGTTFESALIYNSSTTCVRIGGSTVTSTTGASIGVGCDLGPSLSIDVRQAFCVSSAASTVTVDVIFGSR